MQFLTQPHIHIFFALFNQKTPKKRYTRKQPIHFSIKISRNLKILKLGMPIKMTPKSQA